MTVRPDQCRFQVTLPKALKVRIDEIAEAAGISANAVAAAWLAQMAACGASPVDGTGWQPKGVATSTKKRPESEAPPAKVADDWEPEEEAWSPAKVGDDWDDAENGFNAAEVLAMMEPAEREALLAAGWTAETIDEVLDSDI